MTNPAVFYNKEDQWEVPSIDRGREPVRMEPYYTIMRLPGETRAEFIQMLPFTPRRRDNLASWMVARSDGDHYGQLLVFQFPKQKLVFGPRQVVGRINQDQVISPQITLWNQQGSEVIQGTLMVIPVEESLLYIRPLYLRAQSGRIPELTRVIVAYQDQIVMERRSRPAWRGSSAGPRLPPRVQHHHWRARRTRGTRRTRQPHRHLAHRAPPTHLGRWHLPPRRAPLTNARSRRRKPATGRSTGEEIKRLGEILARMK